MLSDCADPVAIIAEHPSLGVQLPEPIKDNVDLVVVADRSKAFFVERKFLVVNIPGNDGVTIGAYASMSDLPDEAEILGQVILVNIPWLPAMKPTKTGFMEDDNLF